MRPSLQIQGIVYGLVLVAGLAIGFSARRLYDARPPADGPDTPLLDPAPLTDRQATGALDRVEPASAPPPPAMSPSQALLAAGSDPDGRANEGELFDRWYREDPQAACEFVEALPDGSLSWRLRQRIAMRLIAIDPVRAVQWLDPLQPAARNNALQPLMLAWASNDLDSAVAYAEGIPDVFLRGRMIGELVPLMWSRDRTRAIALCDMLSSGQRQHAYAALANAWSKDDLTAVLDWLETWPDGVQRKQVFWGIAERLLKEDPLTAAALFMRYPNKEFGDTMLSAGSIARRWAERDYASALQWVEGLDPGPARLDAITGLANAIPVSDPERDIKINDLARRLQNGAAWDGFPRAARLLAWEWAEFDRTAAYAWVLSIPDPGVREQALYGVVLNWAYTNAAEAAAFVQSRPASNVRDAMARKVADCWTDDRDAATAWALAYPEASVRAELIQELMANWNHADPSDAARYIRALPSGTLRDAAVVAYVRDLTDDPGTAIDWMAEISSPARIEEAVRILMNAWLRSDPSAATTWLLGFRAIGPAVRDEILMEL